MSGPIDDALNHLKTCAGDVGHARTSAAAALDRTHTAQQRAGQAGFQGVAHHLDRSIRTLEGHLAQLVQLAATIDKAIADERRTLAGVVKGLGAAAAAVDKAIAGAENVGGG
jgi:ABC-type transporter Mla subunit MlaD